MAKEISPKRSAQKRHAIVNAATDVFLESGYLGTNMDEIAARAGVSKQTVYKHFSSKETLFIELVTAMTDAAGDVVHEDVAQLNDADGIAEYLCEYAYRQLSVVLTPRLIQLRRLVIGEVARFPELAKVLYERGPARAMASLARHFERMAALGRLRIDDPDLAASHFNWLVMASPLNQAMLLGDAGIPGAAELRRQAREGVRVFLAAYGNRETNQPGGRTS